MFDIERWQEIFEAIRKNRLRTFLTGLSVASGIFILVILLGFGQGMQNGIAQEFEGDSATLIGFWGQTTTKPYKGLNPGRRIQLRNNDYERINSVIGEELETGSGVYRVWNALVSFKNETSGYRVEGVYSGMQTIENQYMILGRYLNQSDEVNVSKVVVISQKVKRELFKNNEDPLEEYLEIQGIKFQVIGVIGDPGGDREENRVFIPLSTAQRVFNGGDRVNNLFFTVTPTDNFNEMVLKSTTLFEKMKSILREVHNISPDDEAAIGGFNTLEDTKRFFSLMKNIKFFFWFVGICTIIAGVVGVGNIMLIVVKERTKEIGIRKAMGAKPWSIIGMILQESIFITTVSGFIGLILSMGLLEIVGPELQVDYILNPSVNFNVAITTVFILIFAGAVAGFFPAWRAANIQTIEALRDD